MAAEYAFYAKNTRNCADFGRYQTLYKCTRHVSRNVDCIMCIYWAKRPARSSLEITLQGPTYFPWFLLAGMHWDRFWPPGKRTALHTRLYRPAILIKPDHTRWLSCHFLRFGIFTVARACKHAQTHYNASKNSVENKNPCGDSSHVFAVLYTYSTQQ